MTVNTDLIILHSTPLGENSLVIHTLSREYGRRGFIVRGIGKRFPASYFLPLNIMEADITENPKSSLYSIRAMGSRFPLTGLRNDIIKNSIALFISEVLYRCIHEGGMEPGLYEWCEREILLLDALGSDFSNFHIRWLLELASALGFSPSAADLAPFTGDDTALVSEFLAASVEESMLIPMNGAGRSRVAGELLRYLEFHTGSALDVRSLKILGEIFR